MNPPKRLNTILLIGCGGVGAPMAIFLANICQHLHIIDHDIYERHNMHRQPLAKGAVGQHKVECLKKALEPWSNAEITAHPVKFEKTSTDLLDFIKPDLIVVCVDNHEAREAIWQHRENYDILWAANEIWDPQAGISLKENPWNPLEAFKPAETTEDPICGQQTVHANAAAAALGVFLLMCHLAEDEEQQPAFFSKTKGTPLYPIPRDEF